MVSEEASLIRTTLNFDKIQSSHGRDITYAAIDCVTD